MEFVQWYIYLTVLVFNKHADADQEVETEFPPTTPWQTGGDADVSSVAMVTNTFMIRVHTFSTLSEDVDLKSKANEEHSGETDVTVTIYGEFDEDISTMSGPADDTPSQSSEEAVLVWKWQSVNWTWVRTLRMTTALLGVVGNLMVIIVLLPRRSSHRSTDVLIGALAAADFLTSVFMIPLPTPLRVHRTWTGEIYCKVISTNLFMWISVDASILTLTSIPLDRYVAISYPLHYKRVVTRKALIYTIATIWIVATVANLFLPVVASVNDYMCVEVFPSRGTQLLVGFVLYFVMFLFPALIMLISQAQTALVLHRQSRLYLGAETTQSSASARHLAAKKRILKMLFFVVIVFIISWGPSQNGYLAYNLHIIPNSYLYSPLYNVFTVLAFCNSCANPIIYALRNPAFRKAIKELFTRSSTASASGRVSIFSERMDGKFEMSGDNSKGSA